MRPANEPASEQASIARKAIRTIWVFAALCCVVLWGGAWGFIVHDRNAAVTAAFQQTDGLARSLAEQAHRSLESADRMLKFARWSMINEPSSDFMLRSQQLGLTSDVVFEILVIDRDGVIVQTAAQRVTGPKISVADRGYFSLLRDNNDDELFIGRPVRGRINNRWSLQLVRRVNDEDGKFAGLVLAALDPFAFAAFYDGLPLGKGGKAGIFRADGALLSQSQLSDELLASRLMVPEAAILAGAPSRHVEQGDQLVSVRRLTLYPVGVSVSLSKAEVLAPVRARQRFMLMAALALTGAVFLFAAKVHQGAARRTGLFAALQAERNRFRGAKEEIDRAYQAQGMFLANMSHELRTPLTSIIGFAQLIRGEAVGPHQHVEYRDWADKIVGSSEHQLELITDLLDTIKVEAGMLILARERVDVGELLQRATASFAPQALAGELTLSERIEPGLLLVCDPERLGQIATNLISNAIKYTPAGGRIEVSAHRDGSGWIALSVRDNGIGMQQDEIALALRVFGQLDNRRNRAGGGTGLGLPLVKRLVELHGGEIVIESSVGKGTTVTVRLPRLGEGGGDPAAA